MPGPIFSGSHAPISNQSPSPAKSAITIMPNQKTGMDTPAIEMIWPIASNQLPGLRAERVPIQVPSRKAIKRAKKDNSMVAGSLPPISSATLAFLNIASPKSPRTARPRNPK